MAMSGIAELRAAILASGPAGYWPMDDLSNLGRDDSGNGLHGVQSGTFTAAEYDTGQLRFSAVRANPGGIVTIPDSVAFAGSTITIEMLIAIYENENTVIAERGADNTRWSLQSIGTAHGLPPGSVQFVGGDRIYGNEGASRQKLLGVCHLIATAVNGYTSIYANGYSLLKSSIQSGSGTQAAGTAPVTFFARSGGLAQTTSALAQIAIYPRALSVAEIYARCTAVGALPQNSVTQPRQRWGNDQSAAELIPPPTIFESCQQASQSIRWLNGTITAPPQRDDYGYIEGAVKNSGVSVPDQRVACFDNSHNLIDEVKSGPDGAYRFDNLPRLNGDTYVVMARDSNGLLSPATADNRIPEAYS